MARPRMKTRKGDAVRIHYTCKLSNGTVIDSSIGREALEFTIGKEEVIKGLEESVAGMKVGESKTVTVAAEKAYGRRHDEWVLEVGRDKVPQDWNPEVGLHYEIPGENGQSMTATVTRVSQSSVTLDFNHPLAGRELIFEISIMAIL